MPKKMILIKDMISGIPDAGDNLRAELLFRSRVSYKLVLTVNIIDLLSLLFLSVLPLNLLLRLIMTECIH